MMSSCFDRAQQSLLAFAVQGCQADAVDRYTSHVIFLMHLAHVIALASWPKVSQCAFHFICMSSMMSHV